MKNRYYRFFRKDENAVMMAFDFGAGGRTIVDDPGKILSAAVEGGIDGFLATYGICKNFRKEIGKAGLMLRIDAGGSALSPGKRLPHPRYAIEDALRLGVDGIMSHGIVGSDDDPEYMQMVADIASGCDRWGLVAAGEMTPDHTAHEADLSTRPPEKMKVACRIAGELGLDFIKTQFIPNVADFKTVVANTYIPLLALGGPYVKDDRVVLQYVRDSMDSGMHGVVMGRNIWNHPNVAGIVSAVCKIVHQNTSVETALKEL